MPPQYIQSDGTLGNWSHTTTECAVNTGLGLSDKDVWTATACVTDDSQEGYVMGGKYTDGDNNTRCAFIYLRGSDNQVVFCTGFNDSRHKVITTDYDVHLVHEYKMDLSTGEAWIDGTLVGTMEAVEQLSGGDLWIMGYMTSTNYLRLLRGFLSDVKIERDGVVVREYVSAATQSSDPSARYRQGFIEKCAVVSGNGEYWFPVWGTALWSYDFDFQVTVTADSLDYSMTTDSKQYPGTIRWGDGTTTALGPGSTYQPTHTYPAAGTYTVKIFAPYSATVNLTKDASSANANSALVTSVTRFASRFVSLSFARNATNLDIADGVLDDVEYIGDRAFNGCSSLTLTGLPQKLRYICKYAFSNCPNLLVTYLPPRLHVVEGNAFENCTNLRLLSMPHSIVIIGASAFSRCSNITVSALPVNLTYLGGQAFYMCAKITVSELPNQLTSLNGNVFRGCNSITSLTINAGMQTIASWAVPQCTGLQSITFLGTPTSINSSAFPSNNKLKNIYVPWAEGEVANAPWGATAATIHYNS
jgi:hypothetical protein